MGLGLGTERACWEGNDAADFSAEADGAGGSTGATAAAGFTGGGFTAAKTCHFEFAKQGENGPSWNSAGANSWFFCLARSANTPCSATATGLLAT